MASRIWRLRPRDTSAMVALIYLITLIVLGSLASVISPHVYTDQNLAARLTPPSWGLGSSTYVLGSDGLGRDTLSRILNAIPMTFFIPAAGLSIAMTIGTIVGVLAGYYGGLLDALLMRLVDMMMGLSTFLLILVLVVLVGGGVKTLILVFGLANWVLFARVARGAVLSLKEMQFVQAARSIGCSNSRLMYAHIAPGLVAVVATLAIVDMGRLMITEAGLSFLGFGVQPPTVTWGLLVAEGQSYLSTAWWLVTFPGLLIATSVLALTLVGGWLRSLTDPFRSFGPRSTQVNEPSASVVPGSTASPSA